MSIISDHPRLASPRSTSSPTALPSASSMRNCSEAQAEAVPFKMWKKPSATSFSRHTRCPGSRRCRRTPRQMRRSALHSRPLKASEAGTERSVEGLPQE